MTENAPARRQATAVEQRQEQAVHAANDLVRSIRADDYRAAIADALPEGVPASRFVRAATAALLANPELALTDHTKFMRAMLRAASDGLVPDGREAAIVERKGEPVYTPMIGGYRKIAALHGWAIEARCVYAGDDFDVELGDEPRVYHRPSSPDRTNDANVTHAYAIGRHRDGRRVVEVLDRPAIDRRRKAAATDKVWAAWFPRMAEKTAGKALFARLPLDPSDIRVRSLLDADELAPGEAAERVYGSTRVHDAERVPARTAEHPQLPAAAPAATEPAGDGAATGGAGTAAPAPPDVPDDEPVVDVAPEPAAPDDAGRPEAPSLEDARALTFDSGPNQGKTLGQIADADGALTYFTWALTKLEHLPPDVAAAIRVVAEHDVPEAWATHAKATS